jgi:hypothetical protein
MVLVALWVVRGALLAGVVALLAQLRQKKTPMRLHFPKA